MVNFLGVRTMPFRNEVVSLGEAILLTMKRTLLRVISGKQCGNRNVRVGLGERRNFFVATISNNRIVAVFRWFAVDDNLTLVDIGNPIFRKARSGIKPRFFAKILTTGRVRNFHRCYPGPPRRV